MARWRATTFAPRDPHDRVQELLLAIHRIVYRSKLPRDHLIVYRKGGTCTLQSPGEVPRPSRCSWGGRRALNALVGGVGTPAHATSRAHKLWARLLRGHAQVLAGGFACDGEPPSMLLTIFRIVYRSSLPHDLLIVYRKGQLRLAAMPNRGSAMSSTFSWGGRRALNALVGGVGTPAQAPFVSPLLVGATRDQKSRGGGRP